MLKPAVINNKIFLVGLLIFLTVSNIIWYFLGGKQLHWDSAIHLGLSLDAYQTIVNYSGFSSFLQNFIGVSWYYPPMVYYLSIPFYFVFGTGEFSAILEITFFLVMLVVSVYLIGKELFNESTGLLAGFLISMYPIVIEFSRDYMLDLPLASIVALNVYLLLRTNNFREVHFSMMLGIAAGAGLLVKWTFLFFLIVPVIYFFVVGMKTEGLKLRVFLNFLISIFIMLLMCTPWYLRNLIMIMTTRSGELSRTDLSFVESLFYYLKVIPGQISVLIVVLFLIALILFFKQTKSNRSSFFLIWWLVGSYVIITLVKIKAPRFSISLLIPLTILFSGMIISSLAGHRRGKLFLYCMILICVLNYFLMSFANIRPNIFIPVIDTPLISNLSPVSSENHNLKILELINDERIKSGRERAILRVIPDEPHFNNSTLKYYARMKEYPIEILGTSGFPMFTDYAVIKTATGSESIAGIRTAITDSLQNGSSKFGKMFEEMYRKDYGDNSELIVYKPDNMAMTDVDHDSLNMLITSSSEKFLNRYLRPETEFKYEIEFDDTLKAISGSIRLLKISTDDAEFADYAFAKFGLRVTDFCLSLKNFTYSIPALTGENSLEILSLEGLEIHSLNISADDLKNYIEISTAGKVKVSGLAIENNFISLNGFASQLNSEFALGIELIQKPDMNLYFHLKMVRLFGIPFPSVLINYMLMNYNPLIRGIEIVEEFKIARLKVDDGKIEVYYSEMLP